MRRGREAPRGPLAHQAQWLSPVIALPCTGCKVLRIEIEKGAPRSCEDPKNESSRTRVQIA
jgi:hypothetical protein